jgi:phosphohistidine phosphatase
MKTLTIVRHAKSDWGNDNLEDIHRPLSESGYADAKALSKQVLKKMEVPDYWLTSPAIRAYSTALIFANTFKYNSEKMSIKKSIYEATIKNLKQVINQIPDNFNNVILFGHNPGLTNFFNEVSDSYADNIPTCGTLHLKANTNKWKDFFSKKIENDFTAYPKDFKQ